MIKEQLLNQLQSNYAKRHAEEFALIVEGATPFPEHLVNPIGNLEAKVEYITNAYTDNLELKPAPHIKITGAYLIDSRGVRNKQIGSAL